MLSPNPTLEERVAALEARKEVSLDDLPLAALQRRLEQRWQPDAAMLLLPGSITNDLLPVKISGEYTASSGSLASGAQTGIVTVSHTIGVVPSLVVGHLEDGSWATHVGWRVNARSATAVEIVFRNNGPNVASAVLRFRLVYT